MNSLILDYFRYNIYGISTLAGSFLSFSVGFFVWSRNWRSKTHFSFFLITFTGGMWMLNYGLINMTSQQENAYLWLVLGYFFGVPYISPSVYLFSVSWTQRSLNKITVILGFVLAFLLSIPMALFKREISVFYDIPQGRFNTFEHSLIGSTFFYSILSFFFIYALLAFWNIFNAWRNATTPYERARYKLFLIGFLVGYTGSIDFFVARGLPFFPFGFISFSLFVLIIAYSVIRHQFLEINVVLKKISLIFFIYAVLFALLLPILFPILSSLFSESKRYAGVVLAIGLGVGTVLSLGPVIYATLVKHSFWLRGNISTGLAHELKSPLSSIQGALAIVFSELEKPNTDREKTLGYLRMIDQNANRLDEFVKNLLNVAKTEEGNTTLTKSRVDLCALLRSVIHAAKPQLDQKSLTVSLNIPEKLEIFGDETKIDQIFSNLLSNAIKFSEGGSLRLELQTNTNQVQFSISDPGQGIAEKDLQKVFDRFYQVSPTSKGAGIGLTISKAWVEAHGGKIWAESAGLDRGTTMKFTLPIH